MATNKDNILLTSQLSTELGKPGTWISGGFITHEEYNQKLIWRRGIDVFDRMRKSDGSIQALLKVCKHPLLAATWDVEPASEEASDVEIAQHVHEELFNRNVNWSDFLRDSLGKLDFGFSLFEKTYGPTMYKGKELIGIDSLGWRKQWSILRWETEDGEPGVTQQLTTGNVSIPEDKVLLFVNDREGDNYQGVSLLRYVYKDWDLKQYVENLMRVVAQRSAGFPVIEYDPNISKADEKKLNEVLENFRSHEKQYMKYPAGVLTKVDWMKIETNIKADLIPMLQYLQHEIDKSILAQFLDLGGSKTGGGSRALSEDHSQLFEKALEAVANEVVSVVNKDLIKQLCDLNYSKANLPNGYPKLTFSNIGDQNLTMMGDFLNKLGQVDLVTPDRDLENKLREWAGAPKLPDDIYNDYANRVTALTDAQPLATATGGVVTPANPAKPTAGKETSKAAAGTPANARTKAAIEQAQHARQNLVAALMEE